MKYKHLFFDLDHTLWDFERNSSEVLKEIYIQYDLVNLGVFSSEALVSHFLRINTALWNSYDRGDLEHSFIREHRFRLVFESLGVVLPDCIADLGDTYLNLLPQKKHLLDGALDVLEYVQTKGYVLHLVTNGFDSIQSRKMKSAGIDHFFQNVITNDKAKAKKPDPRIFACALDFAGAQCHNCLMIGDNYEADIMGAKRFGMDTVFYNPDGLVFDEAPTFNIRHLLELKGIL